MHRGSGPKPPLCQVNNYQSRLKHPAKLVWRQRDREWASGDVGHTPVRPETGPPVDPRSRSKVLVFSPMAGRARLPAHATSMSHVRRLWLHAHFCTDLRRRDRANRRAIHLCLPDLGLRRRVLAIIESIADDCRFDLPPKNCSCSIHDPWGIILKWFQGSGCWSA